jgi:hypothetical protein
MEQLEDADQLYMADLSRLRENANHLLAELGGSRDLYLAIFSAGSVTHEVYVEIENGHLLRFSADDLLTTS